MRKQVRKADAFGLIPAAASIAVYHPLGIARDEPDRKASRSSRDVVGERLYIACGNPWRAHGDADFIRDKVFRDDLSECVRVLLVAWILCCGTLRLRELFPDVAGKVLVARLVAFRYRIFENLSVETGSDRLRCAVHELRHVRQVHAAFVSERRDQRVAWIVNRCDLLDRRNRALLEDGRFFGLPDFLLRAKAGIRYLLQRHDRAR